MTFFTMHQQATQAVCLEVHFCVYIVSSSACPTTVDINITFATNILGSWQQSEPIVISE
jgi:hypothetical protein